MSKQRRHEMQLKTESTSGTELWYCPTCGRQFLLSYPPKYKKIIIEAGDGSAIHSGGTGDLSIGQLHIGEPEEPELPASIRSSLEKILRDFDLDH